MSQALAAQIAQNKKLVQRLRAALYDFDAQQLPQTIEQLFAPDAVIQLCHPFETLPSRAELAEVFLQLASAIPDLERRDTIVIGGPSLNDSQWVGCCGYYTGSFEHTWLGIPATGHQVHLRFHEFYRIEDNQIIEMQAIWDIPELMMQANVWPMVPSLGKEWHVPGPATQDGIVNVPYDNALADSSRNLVNDMCNSLGNYASQGVAGMQLEKYWHPRSSWYGPSGIGTGRGIEGFRNWHQIPFLNGLPNRVGDASKGYLFADDHYVGFTAWPGMHMTVSGDGWLGIAPANQNITMRSLDFWRCENGLIRENWVLIDLLHVYKQLNVDVLARMQEINKARKR
ncbi:polyketide cyclase [Thalassotalea sp. HSM 43]|uniref:ester cyclase n=1 Tax=Thalassotalea sp. HSM 43 TaxID=2552945 RepID=UPI001080E434|nr:ester cyclase [Thalassotalea sp. HSM 43]QBY04201.1 polyketide cyclase [Thalassotalea sp. HSM 43]